MPEPVELILKADNSQYVSKVKEAQKATQDLHNTAAKGTQREKGLIQDIEDELTKLQQKQKEAWRVEDITKYNQKIAEAKKDLKEYNELGLKTEKTTESLSKSIGKWVLSLGAAALILKKLKDAFLETTAGINLFNQAGAITKTILNDIVTTGQISIKTIKQTVEMQKILNKLRLEEMLDRVTVSKLNIEYQRNYIKAIDQTATSAEQLLAIDAALAAHDESINIRIKDLQIEAEARKKLIEATLVPSEKMVMRYAELMTEINNLEAERDASTKRLHSRQSGIIKDMFEGVFNALKGSTEAITKWEDDYNTDRLKRQEEYQKLSLQLLDEHEKSIINSLEGKEKLEAERKYEIKQLKEFKDQLAKLGNITEDQKGIFQEMVDNIWKEYFKELADGAKDAKPTAEQQDAISKALLGDLPALEGLIKKNVSKLSEQIAGEAATRTETPFSFWKLLGFDPESEDDAEVISAIQDAASRITDIFEGILDQRVEMAERERELLDTRISETQRELDLEAELMEAGFANNLTARKAYLEQLKQEREKALEDERKAIKAQQAFETVLQTTNLITASSEVMKAFSKIPIVGIPLGIAMIATMFGAFISAKTKAANATKLAEGGSGTVTGKRHSQGGERFLDHVEIEQGEQWGVLSRRASGKYGDMFHDMVSSFNRDQMPDFITPMVSNNIRVENSGPNTRLDCVIKEQEKMNTELKRGQLYTVGNKRILKSGNKTRIIG